VPILAFTVFCRALEVTTEYRGTVCLAASTKGTFLVVGPYSTLYLPFYYSLLHPTYAQVGTRTNYPGTSTGYSLYGYCTRSTKNSMTCYSTVPRSTCYLYSTVPVDNSTGAVQPIRKEISVPVLVLDTSYWSTGT